MPFIKDIMEVTRCIYNSKHVGYVNSDILFTSNLFAIIDSIPRASPALFPIVIEPFSINSSMSWHSQ